MCIRTTNREAEMQRLALVLAVTATILCCGSATRARRKRLWVRGLPAASLLVSARLGIDGSHALLLLRLWKLSTNRLLLSGSLPASCVDSRGPPGPSPAVPEARLVVVT